MQVPTQDQLKASGRHVLTMVAAVIGTLAALKVISAGDAANLQSSLDQISHGAAEFLTGVTALVVALSGAYAAISANPIWQLLRGAKAISADPTLAAQVPLETKQEMVKATDKLPGVDSVVASPEIANAVPSNTVQSSEDVKVVSK